MELEYVAIPLFGLFSFEEHQQYGFKYKIVIGVLGSMFVSVAKAKERQIVDCLMS